MGADKFDYDVERAAIDPVYRREVIRQLKQAASERPAREDTPERREIEAARFAPYRPPGQS